MFVIGNLLRMSGLHFCVKEHINITFSLRLFCVVIELEQQITVGLLTKQ